LYDVLGGYAAKGNADHRDSRRCLDGASEAIDVACIRCKFTEKLSDKKACRLGFPLPDTNERSTEGYSMTQRNDESGLPENRLWQPATKEWFFVVFGAALAYAVVRYHLAGNVSWNHFPLFILNKATSLAAVVFVACSYLIGWVIRWHNDDPVLKLVVIKFCGLMGFSLAAIHAFFSVCLLTPAYFGRFFGEDQRLNFAAEIGIAAGVVALWALAFPAIATLPMMPKSLGGIRWKRTQRMGYFCLGLVVAHMVAFGIHGWLRPSEWPWGLPPISMLAAVVAVTPLVFKWSRSR
jgi:DMSO/TMAO reductase YedYZ heme-binding membrane subunit